MQSILNTITAYSPHTVRSVMWFIFAGAALVYILCTAILLFHWRSYGMKAPSIKRAEVVYFVSTILLIALALLTILAN